MYGDRPTGYLPNRATSPSTTELCRLLGDRSRTGDLGISSPYRDVVTVVLGFYPGIHLLRGGGESCTHGVHVPPYNGVKSVTRNSI